MSLFGRSRSDSPMDAAQQMGEAARARIRKRPIVAPPSPWKASGGFAVGGLTEVGFGEDSDLLLVVSSQGRGVFDALNGERIERNGQPDWDGLDQEEMLSPGIGPLLGVDVPIAGLHGGAMRRSTDDGWVLTVEAIDWPIHHAFLWRLPETGRYLPLHQGGGNLIWKCAGSDYRTAGFSPTGRSFVLASSSDIELYSRGS